MSVSEYERTQLFAWFEEHMGKERAQAMIAMLPPVGWGDVATRRDLELLEAKLDARIDRLDSRINELRTELHAELTESHASLLRTLVPWLFASQATVVASVGVLLAVFR
jgi:hypothetical protein